ncbi:hypothetical protein [Armatimonas sp.]|uniref:hypothetical protein n=1 Tax=Armatimonas sp. TaxID=1872638 RepID=UPI00375310CE
MWVTRHEKGSWLAAVEVANGQSLLGGSGGRHACGAWRDLSQPRRCALVEQGRHSSRHEPAAPRLSARCPPARSGA